MIQPSETLNIGSNVRSARTKSSVVETIDEDALILLMLGELHANVPEADRPMSMSDLSDDQAQRARSAVRRVIVASLLSVPAGRFASIAELENAIAMEARSGETPESGSTAEGGDSAGPKDIAQ